LLSYLADTARVERRFDMLLGKVHCRRCGFSPDRIPDQLLLVESYLGGRLDIQLLGEQRLVQALSFLQIP
jgi:hypothetical protein